MEVDGRRGCKAGQWATDGETAARTQAPIGGGAGSERASVSERPPESDELKIIGSDKSKRNRSSRQQKNQAPFSRSFPWFTSPVSRHTTAPSPCRAWRAQVRRGSKARPGRSEPSSTRASCPAGRGTSPSSDRTPSHQSNWPTVTPGHSHSHRAKGHSQPGQTDTASARGSSRRASLRDGAASHGLTFRRDHSPQKHLEFLCGQEPARIPTHQAPALWSTCRKECIYVGHSFDNTVKASPELKAYPMLYQNLLLQQALYKICKTLVCKELASTGISQKG